MQFSSTYVAFHVAPAGEGPNEKVTDKWLFICDIEDALATSTLEETLRDRWRFRSFFSSVGVVR